MDPSRFHLVPQISLDFEEGLLDALLSEAVNLGASDFELERLMREYEREHVISSGLENGTAGGPRSINPRLTLDPELTRAFREAKRRSVVNAYNAKVDAEFSSLPKFPKHIDPPFKSLGHYRNMRPIYYQYGYSTPFETIFSRIVPGSFLGKTVDRGLHEVLATKLADVETTLNKWSERMPGLTSQVAKEIKSILGTQPRPIEGSSKLSNHAWGLAIDIDAARNPRIWHRTVINVLLEVTGYDFGRPFVPGGSRFDKKDIAIEEWNKARDASERLKDWLRTYLPIAVANPYSDPQRDPDLEIALERIGILLKYIPLEGKHPWDDSLKNWADHGILSIPPLLIAAMVENGLKWGGQYKESKDFMHFELLAAKVLPPDHPPRSVRDLLTNPKAGAIKAGQRKRRASHR